MNLLEALIALSIMAIMAAVAVSGRVESQPGLELQRQVSELRAEAALSRHRAVVEGESVELAVPEASCSISGETVSLKFYADGTASGDQICMVNGDLMTRLELDPLTGLLVKSAP